ncbi:olfactory receptor 2K2-like [Rhinophrynus dorsalis]
MAAFSNGLSDMIKDEIAVQDLLKCCLLTAMSFDRYLAICNPLRYHSIMNFKLCLHLIICYTSFVVIEHLVLSVPVTIFPFVFIIVTYTYIIRTILKIPSTSGRQKAFSTCSSHLTVVFMYYGTIFIIYLVPSRGYLKHINKFLSLLYTVLTPMLNPIIYSLRNQEIRRRSGDVPL